MHGTYKTNRHIKTVYILGNGFDIELGYPTRYSDFINSKEWKTLLSEELDSGLLIFLENEANNYNWFDLEYSLLKYASNVSFTKNVTIDQEAYIRLCQALIIYIRRILEQKYKDVKTSKETNIARIFLENLNICDMSVCYSFNYTDFVYMYFLFHDYLFDHAPNVINIHGYCGDFREEIKFKYNSIILGIADIYANKLAPGYDFLLKSSNSNYNSTKLDSDLKEAENIVIFGHSLNDMDKVYFEDMFLTACEDMVHKKIFIITKDDDAVKSIKSNIRSMGVNLQKLYSSVTLDFYKTDELKSDKKLLEKFTHILQQL